MPRISPIILMLTAAALTLTACQAPTPEPTATVYPTSFIPTPLPAATSAPQHPAVSTDAKQIDFSTTTMMVLPGKLKPGEATQLLFKGESGRNLIVKTAVNSGAWGVISVWGADGKTLVPEIAGISEWDGNLPSTQNYYLNLRNAGINSLEYELTIKMPPMARQEAKRIQFQPGSTGGSTAGELSPGTRLRYVLTAAAGQQMTVSLTTGSPDIDAYLYIWSADGTIFTLSSPAKEWTGRLPATQDYYIELVPQSGQSVAYQLNITIPPLPTMKAIPTSANKKPEVAQDQVIRYDKNPLVFTYDGKVISGQRDRFTLTAKAGETLEVVVKSEQNNAFITISGPDGKVLPGTEEGKNATTLSRKVEQAGTYAILVGPIGAGATYTLDVVVE